MSAYMRRISGVYQKDIDENMEHRVTAEVAGDCVEGGRKLEEGQGSRGKELAVMRAEEEIAGRR